jgi:radical SAM superfamily enzyme YgiQ (UPF0313 family)
MRILLIAPASGLWHGIAHRKTFNGKVFRFSMLSLLTLAELSPDDADITIVDEQIEKVPEYETFDLVGITVMTATAPRAYELASRFRQRGVPVVLGGFHPTLNPEEALRHADAVVVGPAYGAWERLLRDLADGRLQGLYYGSLDGNIPKTLPRHLMSRPHYATLNATFATIGCRNACRFCSIRAVHSGARVLRGVRDVVAEVAAFRGRFFMLVDDNLTQDRDYALDLFRALAPLKKRWITQASVEIADDPELLAAMRRAGCIGVFVGLETFSEDVLRDQRKEIKPAARYREAVRAFHRHGMFVEAGIIFGFDADDVSVFHRTLGMLERAGVDGIQVSILTPLPGTPLSRQMERRIFDRNWERYDYRHVVFTPARMRPEELQAGADWVIRRFYSPLGILRRLLRWLFSPGGTANVVTALAINLAYYGRTRSFRIRGYDPAARRKHCETGLLAPARGASSPA